MRARNNYQPHLNASFWQLPSSKTEGMLDRVIKTAHELRAIRTELHRELSERDGLFRTHSAATAGPLAELKAAADEIRRTLWLYLEMTAEAEQQRSKPDLWQDPQERPEAAHLVKQEMNPPAADVAAGSFFERLNTVIESCLQSRGVAINRKSKNS